LQRRLHAELGQPRLVERFKAGLAVGAALWTGLTLKLDLFQHPKLMRTNYRMPSQRWMAFDIWEELHHKASVPDLSVHVELQHAKKQVWLRLEGALSAATAEGRDNASKTRWRGARAGWFWI
jgi:hypothetical protein